jgi:hypothetical protein
MMKRKPKNSLQGLIRSMAIHGDREKEELRRLRVKNPRIFDVATMLTDAIFTNLLYLCHFTHAVTHDKKRVEMHSVTEALKQGALAMFKQITGQHYNPSICRQLEWKRRKRCSTST